MAAKAMPTLWRQLCEPAVAHSCRGVLLRYGGGVDCYGGTATAQLAAAAQDGKREPAGGADCRTRAAAGAAGYRGPTVQPAVTPEPRDFTALLERNPEVIGWIKIDDTDVDLPVMQREGDNSYYLKHDLDGNWDDLGLPYLDYECDIQQSRHLILYGHNMGVGDTVRFSSLQNYREPEYYQEHPVIELDSLNGGQYYKIVAVYAITTRESDGDVFHFNQYVNFADDAAEQEYLDEVAKRAFYTTGDYARADERLLTLCTCTYEMSDARLLIMARPLRDGETLTADEVIINPDPLLPARWPAGA